MYQTLRSVGTLSYASVESRYEAHQSKWPVAVWIEDAWFKYIDPLISPDPGKEPTGVYLPMMQGSKEEQRKWWLSNRFRYMDSKWNAGDALSQVIQLRGYAKANIMVTPYSDIYPTVKYASYLVQARGQHDVPTTLVCPLDTVNDTEIYIYSAPQISSIGDLSGLKVGFADFSQATRLQTIKLGDSSIYYSNANLDNLTLGSNRLLKVLDVRNCVALGTGDQKTVDLSGCTGIEEVYFDGTKITGVTLPNGGVLRVLHLPSTITSLIIRNQPALVDFTCPSLSNITTLRLENTGTTVDTLSILEALTAGARVRLFGFLWQMQDAADISDAFDILDDMRGLDQNGDNTPTAQAYGTIHVPNVTGDIIAHANARYPDITITYDHVTAVLTYKDNDGTVLGTETITDGGAPNHTPTMTDKEDNRYYYTFLGWGTVQNGSVEAGCMNDITADTTVYAIYRLDEKVYTVRFYNGSTLMATYQNVLYGDSIDYDVTPSYSGPGNAGDYVFTGWSPLPENITADTDCYAQYQFVGMYFRQFMNDTLTSYVDDNSLTSVAQYAFAGLTVLEYISMPSLTLIPSYCFAGNDALETLNIPSVLAANTRAFASLPAIEKLTIPELTVINGAPMFNTLAAVTEIRMPKLNTMPSSGSISGCDQLELVDFGVVTAIGQPFSSFFFENMTYIILRNTTTVAEPFGTSNTIFYSSSPLGKGNGKILVPRTMVDSYKAHTRWGAYAAEIFAIEDNPDICG